MQLVKIKILYLSLIEEIAAHLANGLLRIVADALTLNNPEEKLSSDDIKVETKPFSLGSGANHNIHIIIYVKGYVENLPERQKLIAHNVQKRCEEKGIFVNGLVQLRLFSESFIDF